MPEARRRHDGASRTACDLGCDVIFDEDQSRLRTGFAAENLDPGRHRALNMMRATKTESGLKVRRKKAGSNTRNLADILAGEG